jgi:chromosome segregation ATPase
MAISGQSVFAILRRSYDRLMQSGSELHRQYTTEKEKLKELLGELDRTLSDLARLYLPELTTDAIAGTFVEVRHELQGILGEQEQARRNLASQLKHLLAEQESIREHLDSVTARLNEKVKEREQCEARLAQRLAADPHFQELSTRLARSEEQLAQNERRLKEVELDASEKLPAYNNSSLFTYLHRRGYGTIEYRASNLITRLDRWVAELIDYVPARRSYEFLTLTPRLMSEELARRRTDFDRLAAEVEAENSRAAKEVGLTKILEEGQALGAERDQIVARQSELVAQIQATEKELGQLASAQNEFYDRGVNRMQDFLRRAETEMLEQRARQTPDPGDDPLVARAADLSRSIDEFGAQLKKSLADQQEIASKASALRSILDQFQQANYDAERSVFSDGFAADALVSSFVRDEIDGAKLWREIVAHQHFRPMQAEWVPGSGTSVRGGGVLLDAVIAAAGAAMEQSARRGASRRWGPSGGSFPSFPTSFPGSSGFPRGGGGGGMSRPRGGGFTTGDGF